MQNIKLNLIPGAVMPVVNVSQYDKARQFSITVYEGSATYSLTGKDVQIRGTKPDGNGFAYDSTDGVVSVSGSTVTISTTQQMTAVGGQTMAELRITQSGVILGTLNFVLMVEPSALSDDTPISDTDIPAIERDFEAALAEAEADALKAEGYAVGTQDGTPAQSGEPYYQDNAKYYKEQAEAAASGGGADALKAEGYAVGTQNGVPVTSGSPYYHNNAAYYDGTASTSATNAATSETNAGLSETAAGNSATSAAADALKSEGFAVGEQNGVPVTSGSPYYQNNAEYYKDQAAQYAAGGLIFKGSVAFASIPTTGMVNGDMYNITDDFTTDNRFIEGSGVSVKAGADIAWIDSVSKWDILALGGGTDSLSGLQDVTLTSPTSGQVLEYDGSKWANANLPTVPSDLDDLSDVTLSSPTSGQFLKYDGSKWINGTGGGGASALDDLTDVDITTPTDGQGLIYDGSKWANSAVASSLVGLSDTAISSPTNGQVLGYDANSGKWKNVNGGGGGSYRTLTAKFDLSDSNPATWGEYMDDAVGMTPGSADFDTFFGIKPVMIKNGGIVGELDPSQGYAKYKDGTNADITSGTEGDVMIYFPRRDIRIWKENGYGYVSITDDLGKTGYTHYAHTYRGVNCDYFAMGRYMGYYDGSKLRSLSGKTPTRNRSLSQFRTDAEANGTGYEQTAFYQLIYRQALYMLKYLGGDAETTVGRGYRTTLNVAADTGGSNSRAMDSGSTVNDTTQVSLFGIEDFWGNKNEFIDGLYCDSSRKLHVADGDYATTANYTALNTPAFGTQEGGYLKDANWTEQAGFTLASTDYGSATTYFCDYFGIGASGVNECWAEYGGNGSTDTNSMFGIFYMALQRTSSWTYNHNGARLMYMHV